MSYLYLFLSILLKDAVSSAVEKLKGKNIISSTRNFRGRQRSFNGESVWLREYFATTVGLDAKVALE